MKKLLLLSLICMVGAFQLSAQSLSLSLEDLDLSNDTLYIIGNTDDVLLEAHVTVNNLTDKGIDVLANAELAFRGGMEQMDDITLVELTSE